QTWADLPLADATTARPSLLGVLPIANAVTAPEWGNGSAAGLPVPASQVRTASSSPAVTTYLLSGVNSAAVIAPRCLSGPPTGLRLTASPSGAVPPLLAVSSGRRSGLGVTVTSASGVVSSFSGLGGSRCQQPRFRKATPRKSAASAGAASSARASQSKPRSL